MALVNFYAAARQAAGSSILTIPVEDLGGLTKHLGAMNEALEKLIPTCSYLLNGESCQDPSQVLNEHDVVDVLPQFAGG